MISRNEPVESRWGRNRIGNRWYWTILTRFWLAHGFSWLWLLFSIYISLPWLTDLAALTNWVLALFIIGGIAYVPGYLMAFLLASLVLDRQPPFTNEHPDEAVTVMIAAYNEQSSIYETIRYVTLQDYTGPLQVFVIDNNSSDATSAEVIRAQEDFALQIELLHEPRAGKFQALNYGLTKVTTQYIITLDADTLIHPSAIRYLVARLVSSPKDVCAVAGSMLVRNSRSSFWTRLQEWDYFLGIASIKRLQGLYQGTLVAQGAFSLYETDAVKRVGGWPDAIGEDIVLTWRLLEMKRRVYFEPLAVAFTDAPESFRHFARQRSRWARGMIEGLQEVKPWRQPQLYTKYLTGVNLIMPYLDIAFTFFWIPGLVLALFGHYWIVGPMTLLVLPLTVLSYGLLYFYQRDYVFKNLNLRVRKNFFGFIFFVLSYQLFMSPISVWGYAQETLNVKRVWK
ncbi:glycosyltransferase family 2 protein [Exiguobacterium sp. SH5S13]|uniref:glycosyltransferase family 2 protein n=1 Tax=Exiguobacterium sp. SH5S13 TaxID=2510959 RepID=UPI001040DEBC|nr:glycosyltransferase [Exiguobacterium sp. SH5S13]TCI56643.1 glycosyltransferase family 2 protein [Exiguobacterium sp. SH5S13]